MAEKQRQATRLGSLGREELAVGHHSGGPSEVSPHLGFSHPEKSHHRVGDPWVRDPCEVVGSKDGARRFAWRPEPHRRTCLLTPSS